MKTFTLTHYKIWLCLLELNIVQKIQMDCVSGYLRVSSTILVVKLGVTDKT